MPALFTYLIVIALLIGGGYGGLSWLAAPEPTKIASAAPQKPPPPQQHYPAEPEMKPLESTSANPTPSRSEPVSADSGGEREGWNEKQSSLAPELGTARGQGREAEVSAPAQDRPGPATNVQVSPVPALETRNEANESVGKAKEGASSAPAKKQIGKMAVAAQGDAQAKLTPPLTTAKTTKQRYAREASPDHRDHRKNAERRDQSDAEQHHGYTGREFAGRPYGGQREYLRSRALALMTLRTIEFPDGRRVSRLLPYRRMPFPMIPYPDDDSVPAFEPDE
jgi:hypothetical protein